MQQLFDEIFAEGRNKTPNKWQLGHPQEARYTRWNFLKFAGATKGAAFFSSSTFHSLASLAPPFPGQVFVQLEVGTADYTVGTHARPPHLVS